MKIDLINANQSKQRLAKNNNFNNSKKMVSFTSGFMDKTIAAANSPSKFSLIIDSIKGKLHKLFERFNLKQVLLNVFEKSRKAFVSSVTSNVASTEEKMVSQAQTIKETKIPTLTKDVILEKPEKYILKAPVGEKQTSFAGLIPEKTTASAPEIKFFDGIAYDKDLNKLDGEVSLPSFKKPVLTFEDGRLTKATYLEGEGQITKEYSWGDSKLENAHVRISNKGNYPADLKSVSFEPDGVVVSEYTQNLIDEDRYLFSGKISKKFQGGKLKELSYINGGSIDAYRVVDFENKKVTFYPFWLQRRVVFDMKNDKVLDYFIDSPEKEIFAFEADRKTGKVKINPRILLMRVAKKEEIKSSAQKALEQFDTYKEKYFKD